jgi:hypothetical protein
MFLFVEAGACDVSLVRDVAGFVVVVAEAEFVLVQADPIRIVEIWICLEAVCICERVCW